MKKIFALTALLATIVGTVWADVPFRKSRWGSFSGLKPNQESIVFTGNSITNMHQWWEAFGGQQEILNRGTSGGFTTNLEGSPELLENLEAIIMGRPAKVFIGIGTNDITKGFDLSITADNIRIIGERIRLESPETEVYFQGCIPSTNGNRGARIPALNTLIKAHAEALNQKYGKVTYLDVFSQMVASDGVALKRGYNNQSIAFDNLHPNALGYKIWCDFIHPQVGYECIYKEQQIVGGMGNNNAFGDCLSGYEQFKVKDTDILMIGSDMIHNGEWHEYMKSADFKNRGLGWGLYSLGMDNINLVIDRSLAAQGSAKPKAIVIYTADQDANNGTSAADLLTKYKNIIAHVHEVAPTSKLFILSTLFNTDATKNGVVNTLNTSLKNYATEGDFTFVDINTEIASNKTRYTEGTAYVYSKGYAKIAQLLATALNDELKTNYQPVSDSEVDDNVALFTARKALGDALTDALRLQGFIGEGVGKYQASEELQTKIAEAVEILKKEAPTADECETAANALKAVSPTINQPTASTEGNEVWYAFKNSLRAAGKVMTGNGENTTVNMTENANYAKQMWKLVARTDGTFDIINRNDGTYLNSNTAYNADVKAVKTAPAAGWTFKAASTAGQYIITAGTVEINVKSNADLCNWSSGKDGNDVTDTGCQFEIVDVTDVEVVNEPDPINVVTGTAQEGAANIVAGHIYTITNHQKNGACYPLYVETSLEVGQVNALAHKSYGNRAEFVAEAKDGKWAFKNVLTGKYLIWKGNSEGYNNNTGVLEEYNSTYCDMTLTNATEVTNGKVITGMRSGATKTGTFVQNTNGSWNKWEGTTVGYTDTYSNIYTFGDVTDGDDGEVEDDPSADKTYTVSKTTGAMSGNGTWNNKWTSADGSLTLTSNANNMQWNGNNIDARSGSAKKATYTLAIANGMEIVSYSFKAKSLNASNTQTWAVDGKTYTVAGTEQTISAENVKAPSVVFTLTGENTGTLLTEFTVVTRTKQAQTEPDITFSTDQEQHWYYIYSTATVDYAKGKVWYYNPSNDRMMFGDKAFMADRIWSFWKNEQGKIAIKNFDGIYVGTAGAGTGGGTQFGKSDTPNYIYQINNIADGQFTISDGGVPLHAQNDGKVLVRWQAEAGNASTWNFQEVNVQNAEATLAATTVQQGKVTTGRGNKNDGIIRSTISVGGLTGNINFTGVQGKVVATNRADVTAVKAYFATNERELWVDADKKMTWRETNGELFGEGTVAADGTYTITGEKSLAPGNHYLWIAFDIAEDAKEGNTVDATITKYTTSTGDVTEKSGNPTHAATIFLSEGSVLMPMDKGSLYYRIPAITATADGKRLITLTDDRKHHNADLPSHCYVVAQYSDDNGKTWSDPVTVAGTADRGGDYGHGDASLITNRINGDIIGIMTCSTYGAGYFASTPDRPQTWKTITSHDGGLTWEEPVDHTKELYGTGSPHPNWLGGFTGSGAGLQKRDGTLVSPFVNRESPDGTNNNVTQQYYNFMSKDGGKTWYVSGTSGTTAADEPKVLERNNGDLAISVRHGGYNWHNVTTDDGQTWKYGPQTPFTSGISGNACDGEYMVWSSTLDGNPWNIAFQTLPNSGSRENVSIALSTDEGETFGSAKTICPRGSAYSAATVLGDGTVGVYYEENGLYGGYTLRFVRFSLDWASNGKYKFTEEAPFHPIQTNVKVTTPTYGMQTLCLPYEQEIPEGMTVYECTDEVKEIQEEGTTRSATVLVPVEGTTLAAFHPYVFTAEGGTEFQFGRSLDEWKSQEMPENCIFKAGPLRGVFVNKTVKGDGKTIFGNPRNIASKGGLVFNRISSTLAIPVYAAYYQMETEAEATPDAIRITFPTADGVNSVTSSTANSGKIYDLNGRLMYVPAKGVNIIGGKKVLK